MSRRRSAFPARAAVSSASAGERPTIERLARDRRGRGTICEDGAIEYVEFQVANDALTVVVNKENDWVDLPHGRS